VMSQMKIFGRTATLAMLLGMIALTASFVLESNLRIGVYPTDADSIGIPLMETVFISAAGAALLVVALAASASSLVLAPRVSRPWRLVLAAIHVLAHAGCFAFFLLWAASWLTPHHYPIAASCLLMAAAVAYFFAADVRSLRSHYSLKSTLGD